MNILQLCCFTNLWPSEYQILNIDLTTGQNVLDLDLNFGKDFDFVLSAPPCTQFTKANSSKWLEYPLLDIAIVKQCLAISLLSGKPWVLENPPGRIEKLIPILSKFRMVNLSDKDSNKEWILYSNFPLHRPMGVRYGKASVSNKSINDKMAYPRFFIDYVHSQLLQALKPGLCSSALAELVQQLDLVLDACCSISPSVS